MLISSQLGRTILCPPTSSADAMIAGPDDSGSYGELDQLVFLASAQGSGNGIQAPPEK